jgi:hypothetical protein
LELSKYNKIIIIGAQRSGTTFASYTLANSLGYRLLDEVEYKNDISILNEEISKTDKLVIQGPVQTISVQEINGLDLIIYMLRDKKDITKSQERIDWISRFEKSDIQSYKNKYSNIKDEEYFENTDLTDIKYDIFVEHQQKIVKCDTIFINYKDLEDSPYFIKKENRINFTSKQVKLYDDINIGDIIQQNGGKYLTINDVICGQTPKVIEAFEGILNKFDRIIEIGSGRGGFTTWLYSKNKNIVSYDIENRLENISIPIKVFKNSDCFEKTTFDEIIDLIQKDGKVLVLCDGGNKEKEFNVFSKYLKKNDVIMLHDYTDNINNFQSLKHKHKWVSRYESHIENIDIHGLIKYEYEKFKNVFWGSFKKQ